MLGSLDYETAAHHVTAETMKALGERLLDRKVDKFDIGNSGVHAKSYRLSAFCL